MSDIFFFSSDKKATEISLEKIGYALFNRDRKCQLFRRDLWINGYEDAGLYYDEEIYCNIDIYRNLNSRKGVNAGMIEDIRWGLLDDLKNTDENAVKNNIVRHIEKIKIIITVEVLWHGRDVREVLEKINPMFEWLFSNYEGLVWAEDDGYYDCLNNRILKTGYCQFFNKI